MKCKKWARCITAMLACTAVVSASAHVFAATSDSYTGNTVNGPRTARITCKINGFNNPLSFGKDSCGATTQSNPEGIEVGAGVSILNADQEEINSVSLTTSMSRTNVRVYSYDNTCAKYGLSAHSARDDNYGNFLYFLGCTFH